MDTKHNIVMAIELMERVKNMEAFTERKLFDMSGFQMDKTGRINPDIILDTEEDIIGCGTTCCFSGWIALDPYFKAQGIHQSALGAAIFDDNGVESEADAIAALFGVPVRVASDLIYANDIYRRVDTPADIITVLKEWIYHYHDDKEIVNE